MKEKKNVWVGHAGNMQRHTEMLLLLLLGVGWGINRERRKAVVPERCLWVVLRSFMENWSPD